MILLLCKTDHSDLFDKYNTAKQYLKCEGFVDFYTKNLDYCLRSVSIGLKKFTFAATFYHFKKIPNVHQL